MAGRGAGRPGGVWWDMSSRRARKPRCGRPRPVNSPRRRRRRRRASPRGRAPQARRAIGGTRVPRAVRGVCAAGRARPGLRGPRNHSGDRGCRLFQFACWPLVHAHAHLTERNSTEAVGPVLSPAPFGGGADRRNRHWQEGFCYWCNGPFVGPQHTWWALRLRSWEAAAAAAAAIILTSICWRDLPARYLRPRRESASCSCPEPFRFEGRQACICAKGVCALMRAQRLGYLRYPR